MLELPITGNVYLYSNLIYLYCKLFFEISLHRVYVNELVYNRFGMRIYDRVESMSGLESEGETEESEMMILILNLTPKKKLILNQMKHQKKKILIQIMKLILVTII